MAKKKEISVEEKLRALFDLQIIDSRIDEIRNVRGELPLEVEDLELDLEGDKVTVYGQVESQQEREKIIFLYNQMPCYGIHQPGHTLFQYLQDYPV